MICYVLIKQIGPNRDQIDLLCFDQTNRAQSRPLGVSAKGATIYNYLQLSTTIQKKIQTMNRVYTRVELNKSVWEVPEQYQNLEPVGSGAYGQVWYVFLDLLSMQTIIIIILMCGSALLSTTLAT